jgi:hypothetical protein
MFNGKDTWVYEAVGCGGVSLPKLACLETGTMIFYNLGDRCISISALDGVKELRGGIKSAQEAKVVLDALVSITEAKII